VLGDRLTEEREVVGSPPTLTWRARTSSWRSISPEAFDLEAVNAALAKLHPGRPRRSSGATHRRWTVRASASATSATCAWILPW